MSSPKVLASYTPRPVLQAGIVLCLAMFTAAAVGVLVKVDPAELDASVYGRFAIWAVIVLCPVYAVDTAVRLVRRTPTVVATDQGLVMRTILGFTPPIPWSEIEAIGPVVMGKKPYLAIFLKNPNASVARLGAGARTILVRSHAEGVPNILFRAIHLGVSPVEAAEKLESIRGRFAGNG